VANSNTSLLLATAEVGSSPPLATSLALRLTGSTARYVSSTHNI